VSEWGDP